MHSQQNIKKKKKSSLLFFKFALHVLGVKLGLQS